jgi:flagellar export protein FliJ
MKQRIATLTRVAEVREIEEEDKVAAVRRARAVLEDEEAALQMIDRAIEAAMRMLFQMQSAPTLDAKELGMLFEYRESMDRSLERQSAVVEAAQIILDARLEELLEAHRERRVIETYRDRLRKEYTRQQDVQEQKQMDALFVSRRAMA